MPLKLWACLRSNMAQGNAVSYTPYPTQQVSGGGGTPSSVRATPEDFGAQVSEQETKAGDAGFELVQKQQNLINETNMVNGETALTEKLGALHGQFMSLTGQAAYDSLPSYLAQAKQAVQEVRGGIRGPQAIHGYDMLAERRLGFTTSDWNGYAASQVRQANQEAHLDSLSASTLRAGDPSVANDDYAFGSQVTGPIKHSTQSMLDETQPGFKTDPETGEVSFDSTPEGQNLKANFQNNLDHNLGQAYIKRYDTLSKTLGPIPAYEKFQQDKDQIPPLAQVQIESTMEPKVFNAKTDSIVNTTMGEARQAHNELLLHPDISQAIHAQESSDKPHDYQIQPDTFKQYAQAGEDFNNPNDQDKVYKRIITDLKQTYPNDPARQAVAYFSGKGNVAPEGNSTPWINDSKDKNGKSVSSYVGDINTRMGNKSYATNPDGSPLTDADYYQTHRADMIQKAQDWAEKTEPGNLKLRNAAVERVNQQMNAAIEDQKARYNQTNHMIIRAFNGDFTKGKQPQTWDDLNNIPGIKDAIDDSSVHSPEFIRTMDARLTSRGGAKEEKTYGKGYMDVMKGIHPIDGTPPTITNENQIFDKYYSGDITDAGRAKLTTELTNAKKDPAGAAGLGAKMSVYNELHKQISFQDVTDKKNPTYDPVGEARYSQAIVAMDSQLEKNRENKIPDDQSLDYQNKNYIGNAAKPFVRTDAERMADRRKESLVSAGMHEGDESTSVRPLMMDLASKKLQGKEGQDQIVSLFHNKKLSRETAEELLIKYGYATKTAAVETPSVPRP